MSKKTTGTDVGYRAYFAAFAVMIIIVIAAICVLSGCLDEVIFKAQTPTGGTSQIENENDPPETPSVPDTQHIPDAPDTSALQDESEPPFADTEDESEPVETEKETEEDTTKAPETTTLEEDTTKAPDVTTPEITTPEVTTPEITTPEETTTDEEDYARDEIFTEQDNNILYSYEDDGLVVTGYDSVVTKLTIARKLDGVEVKSIGNGAFDGLGSLVEVRISAGVKSIGSKAFANCSVLNYVFIPSSVKDIASNAFEGSSDVVIYGVKGSYAEHFAADNGFEFKEQ